MLQKGTPLRRGSCRLRQVFSNRPVLTDGPRHARQAWSGEVSPDTWETAPLLPGSSRHFMA
ncbi:hypothetical protein STPYR_10389 [uncultured Stenotrophomonas sp.]|uniref:Uncharacterized protein n=1 Tax=uncultured Stenotrophomonas sp. TaxID=165438 RepID=A0A1Y5PZN6_9GAMM|nr:hypothetical protein STPYR_10389 [uncultured Stenotrophomonas sp.]